MNWFLYLPPLLSIYLLLVSGVSTSYFKNKVNHYVERKPKLRSHREVIEYVALDWSTRLSFFNSMFAAMVSAFSIFSRTKDFVSVGITVLILLAIFIPMGWWIHGHDIDELPSTMSRWMGMRIKNANLCRVILFVVNILLIFGIYLSQRQPSPPSQS